MSLRHVLTPAFLVYMDGASGAAVDMSSCFFAADGTFHESPPPLALSFFVNDSLSDLLSPSPLESVT